jgi:hypothetical protein
MKQSVNQILEFFRKHKYGRLSLILLLLGLVVISAILIRSSAGKTSRPERGGNSHLRRARWYGIEELQGSDILIIHYKDGSQDTTRRDQSTSFLEQMQFLGVSRSEISKLEYEIVESKMAPAIKSSAQ